MKYFVGLLRIKLHIKVIHWTPTFEQLSNDRLIVAKTTGRIEINFQCTSPSTVEAINDMFLISNNKICGIFTKISFTRYVDKDISRVKSFMNVVHVSSRIWKVLRRGALSEHAKFCCIISAMLLHVC